MDGKIRFLSPPLSYSGLVTAIEAGRNDLCGFRGCTIQAMGFLLFTATLPLQALGCHLEPCWRGHTVGSAPVDSPSRASPPGTAAQTPDGNRRAFFKGSSSSSGSSPSHQRHHQPSKSPIPGPGSRGAAPTSVPFLNY